MEVIYHIDEIDAQAHQVLKQLSTKTLLFKGAMGVGKTTFINALLKALKSEDTATSPTFSIVNEYVLPNDKVYHFDCYRLESLEDAYNFGIEDYLNSDHWLFIEWPEVISQALPKQYQTLTITDLTNDKRSLKLTIIKENLTKNNAMTEPKV